jgi:S-adenosylmethionine:tRNA ribosyltransferase-isomerase
MPMRSDELDFLLHGLPPPIIAQAPAADRAASRLLHYRRDDRSVEHRQFAELPRLLRGKKGISTFMGDKCTYPLHPPGDLLVFNDARVIPARFTLQKETGGIVEGLYLSTEPDGAWRVMLRNVGRNAAGRRMRFADAVDIAARVLAQYEEGQYTISVETQQSAGELLARIGRMPLPPYIHRQRRHDELDELDRLRYQTVYAREAGSVAAPTAGLHFTEELLRELDAAGIQRAHVTLHVGLGTFKPVTADTLEAHHMHCEAYSISQEAADAMNRAKAEGRRIVAVGTTAARVLESQPADAPFVAKQDQTQIFIYPPYRWRHVDALITNFHLPRSTLIALVAALVGLDEQRRLYRLAIENGYRFFSYGDAMLVE